MAGVLIVLVGIGKYTLDAELKGIGRPDYFLPALECIPSLLNAIG